ncbi:MAG: Uncharacterized protein FD122_3251 [Stygiobacter sp.]|nr:MAG: Uncharacterized protein FD122_3251 [Stygiobacter sp.]KAF0215413.1 MAG: hypothetical protein FD178_1697 [Ignavibacteria bacterium]
MSSVKDYLVFAFWISNVGFGFCIGIVVNKISDSFPEWLLIVLLLLFVPFFIYNFIKTIKSINPNIKANSLEDEVSQKVSARKGLIVFLSLYKNFDKNKTFTDKELQEFIKNRDYNALQLSDTSLTNFGPAINAIKAHSSKLEHLWVVTTKAPLQKDSVTSSDYLPVFREFIKNEIKLDQKVEIHDGKNYSVSITETSNITEKTYEQIKCIYKEAKKDYQLNAKDIIVDTTGGFTVMTVGAVLASLAKDQDVQVMSSEYDKQTGNPIFGGKSYPVQIGYAPQFSKE